MENLFGSFVRVARTGTVSRRRVVPRRSVPTGAIGFGPESAIGLERNRHPPSRSEIRLSARAAGQARPEVVVGGFELRLAAGYYGCLAAVKRACENGCTTRKLGIFRWGY